MLSSFGMIVLFGWLAAGPLIVLVLGPRRGMLGAILLGWLFLPMASIPISGMPDFSKLLVVPVAALIGVLIAGPARLAQVRPRMIDVPVLVWCLVPLASSLSNGLGLWDGATAVLHQFIVWGIPWWLARAYLGDQPGLRDLALAIVIGGLIYLPFCVWEIRMSPNLHHNLYGFHQHQFIQTRRFGGWRPMVFMQHGLAVALFMAGAALIATWLWATRAQRRLYGVPISLIAIALIVVTVLCKSAAAVVLLALFLGLLLASRALKIRLALAILLAVPLVYMTTRTLGIWRGDEAVTVVEKVLPNRADSLRTRFHAEDVLVEKALQQPIVGWGGWGRSRVTTDAGYNAVLTDGFWIIAFGQHGLVGLTAVTAMMLLPAFLLLRRLPPSRLFGPGLGPALALAAVTAMFALDSLLNAMFNPMWVLAMGGLAGALTSGQPAPRPATLRELQGNAA